MFQEDGVYCLAQFQAAYDCALAILTETQGDPEGVTACLWLDGNIGVFSDHYPWSIMRGCLRACGDAEDIEMDACVWQRLQDTRTISLGDDGDCILERLYCEELADL